MATAVTGGPLTEQQQDMTPQQAAAAGLGWVDRNNPNYGKAGFVGSQPGAQQPSPQSTQSPQPNGQLQPSPAPVQQIPMGSPQPSPTGGTAGTAGQSALSGMLRQTLMSQLGTNPNQVAITDADIAPQSEAFRASTQRDLATAQRNAAEAAGAKGLASSGSLRARSDALNERAAQMNAANDAQLIGQKQQQRLDTLKNAQQMAASLGLAEEANDLQRQITNLQAGVTGRGQDIQLQLGQLDAQTKTNLANLDAQLQREGYSTQERIAAMDAELRKLGITTQANLGEKQLALDYLRTQLQNQQFNDQLGFDIGSYAAGLNRDYTLAGLRG